MLTSSKIQIALKRFIDDVAVKVIEEKLLAVMTDILSPVAVFEMSDELVEMIAGESQESRTLRAQLTKQIDVLETGSETCKRFAGSQWIGKWINFSHTSMLYSDVHSSCRRYDSRIRLVRRR